MGISTGMAKRASISRGVQTEEELLELLDEYVYESIYDVRGYTPYQRVQIKGMADTLAGMLRHMYKREILALYREGRLTLQHLGRYAPRSDYPQAVEYRGDIYFMFHDEDFRFRIVWEHYEYVQDWITRGKKRRKHLTLKSAVCDDDDLKELQEIITS